VRYLGEKVVQMETLEAPDIEVIPLFGIPPQAYGDTCDAHASGVTLASVRFKISMDPVSTQYLDFCYHCANAFEATLIASGAIIVEDHRRELEDAEKT
jgi:hypothetical protein